jgi:hypothetical protein
VANAKLDTWLTHMRRGNFAAAWEISDRSLRELGDTPDWHLPRHEQHVWRGAPLAGKRVLVRCYRGLGDTIQFARYLPMLRGIAQHVTVWLQPSLIPLFRTAQGHDQLLPLHDGTPEADYDADVEIMELAHVFRTTVATIPNRIPYFHVDPAELPSADVRRVGVVWKSGDWDPRRCIPLPLIERLASVPGVTLLSLQQDAAQQPLAKEPLGTARLMRALDLVITVDSMPAHLAGALGVPVWTLLRKDADWRWMEGRTDSPWYPTMRLFRQERLGEWEPVIARVRRALSP